MSQQHYSHIHLALSQLTAFLFQCHTILFINIDIFIIRYNAQDWYATEVLQHPSAFVEEAHIPTELIDDDALDEFAVF